jgi:hypothetical protein
VFTKNRARLLGAEVAQFEIALKQAHYEAAADNGWRGGQCHRASAFRRSYTVVASSRSMRQAPVLIGKVSIVKEAQGSLSGLAYQFHQGVEDVGLVNFAAGEFEGSAGRLSRSCGDGFWSRAAARARERLLILRPPFCAGHMLVRSHNRRIDGGRPEVRGSPAFPTPHPIHRTAPAREPNGRTKHQSQMRR